MADHEMDTNEFEHGESRQEFDENKYGRKEFFFHNSILFKNKFIHEFEFCVNFEPTLQVHFVEHSTHAHNVARSLQRDYSLQRLLLPG